MMMMPRCHPPFAAPVELFMKGGVRAAWRDNQVIRMFNFENQHNDDRTAEFDQLW